jgi:hypothetical protein
MEQEEKDMSGLKPLSGKVAVVAGATRSAGRSSRHSMPSSRDLVKSSITRLAFAQAYELRQETKRSVNGDSDPRVTPILPRSRPFHEAGEERTQSDEETDQDFHAAPCNPLKALISFPADSDGNNRWNSIQQSSKKSTKDLPPRTNTGRCSR